MELVVYPAPVLSRRCSLVPDPASVGARAREMIGLMRRSGGIGLAAPQVGEAARYFVLGLPRDRARVFINPQIVRRARRTVRSQESCLSLPDMTVEIDRWAWVEVAAWNEVGQRFELRARGLLARAIQHEMDHLDGVLCIDRIDPKRRERIARRLEAEKDHGPAARIAP